MADAKQKIYVKRQCNHCSNAVSMEEVARYSAVERHVDDKQTFEWEAGYFYQVLKCPACGEITFQRDFYHEYMDRTDPPETLYPSTARQILGLPPKLEVAYQAALKVRNIDPNAYAVLLGRVIELLCVDKKAEGKALFEKFKFLADNKIIPEPLVEMAQSLRGFRNIGAHATLGEVPASEIPFLEDLCRAILEYVYSGPRLIENARKRLDLLKGKGKSSKNLKSRVKKKKES